MFHRKSPMKKVSKDSVDTRVPLSSNSNPFDSHNESDYNTKPRLKPAQRTSSEPSLISSNFNANPFDGDDFKGTSESASLFSNSYNSSARNNYKNDFRDSGGLENQSVQELEEYAVYKAEETTKTVNSCLKIAEDMREDATKTLVTLHHQGEQITRTHMVAADIDHDLSRGEKLLGSLGGMFSKTWKPKKTRHITGPMITRDDSFIKRTDNTEQREKLGLGNGPKGRRSVSRTPPPEPTNAFQKVDMEKSKQDDGLENLSSILDDLKYMAVDMGSEIEKHNKALGHADKDVEELNYRVKGANMRGRRLLGK